jgi:hypothetical protein
MNVRDVRAGIQQSKLDETAWGILSFEAFMIAVIAGVRAESWGAGIAALLCVIALLRFAATSGNFISNTVAFIIGAAWAFAAFNLSQEAQPDTAIMVASLAFLIGGGVHIGGFRYLRDLQAKDQGATKPSGEDEKPAAPPAEPTQSSINSQLEALEHLVKLRDVGALTDAEFQAAKKKILDG